MFGLSGLANHLRDRSFEGSLLTDFADMIGALLAVTAERAILSPRRAYSFPARRRGEIPVSRRRHRARDAACSDARFAICADCESQSPPRPRRRLRAIRGCLVREAEQYPR